MKLINIDSPVHDILYFLERAKIYPEGQFTSLTKPGEGNMNVVLRATFENQSFILKQSRPYVAKYEFLEAPKERILVEAEFYHRISTIKINSFFPKIFHVNEENFLLIMEDLGDGSDFTKIYNSREISQDEIYKLTGVLNELHRIKDVNNFPPNHQLKALNHQHIFSLPFEKENGFQLDDVQLGLGELSEEYKRDESLKRKVREAGDQYLSKGTVLLHGDYYPGSWISVEGNTYVIDPEFSFAGFAEFDLGVMAAHLLMTTHRPESMEEISKSYDLPFDEGLFYNIAGIEIMRRLIGLAQLPLSRSLEEKDELLKIAYQLINS